MAKVFRYKTGFGDEFLDACFNKIKPQIILLIAIEAYVPVLVSGYANFYLNLDSTLGESLGFYSSIYCLVMGIVIVPATLFYVFSHSHEKMEGDDEFREKWAFLYEN